MKIVSLSATHHDCDLNLLDRLGRAAQGLEQAVVAQGAAHAVVVLATCNRFEVYLEVVCRTASRAVDHVVEYLATAGQLNVAQVRSSLKRQEGRACLTHLFAVASGLDSMVVGEREIVGQVSRALVAARKLGTAGALTQRAFQDAVYVSREVEQSTHLGSVGRSVVSVGLELAGQHISDWRQSSVLLVGSGKYAGATLAALRRRGCNDIRVYSRSGRAEQFAAARDLEAVTAADFVRQVGAVDLVVSCSGRGDLVLDLATVRAAGRSRQLTILDLALGGDVDPALAELPEVQLIDLMTIKSVAPSVQAAPIRKAELVIEQGVERWYQWRDRRDAYYRRTIGAGDKPRYHSGTRRSQMSGTNAESGLEIPAGSQPSQSL